MSDAADDHYSKRCKHLFVFGICPQSAHPRGSHERTKCGKEGASREGAAGGSGGAATPWAAVLLGEGISTQYTWTYRV